MSAGFSVAPHIVAGFNRVQFADAAVFEQTMAEAKIIYSIDLGGGSTLHMTVWNREPLVLVEIPGAELQPVFHPHGFD